MYLSINLIPIQSNLIKSNLSLVSLVSSRIKYLSIHPSSYRSIQAGDATWGSPNNNFGRAKLLTSNGKTLLTIINNIWDIYGISIFHIGTPQNISKRIFHIFWASCREWKTPKYETLSIQFLIDMQVTYGIPVSAVCFESSSSWGFNPFPDMKVKLLCHPN
jgi:hypothetical protein